ncbi:MAG TPA: type II secretion system protein [Tepidisphaeraceae bacterium]|jgi:prepilin-type N-terminal cleavage/methylation domain-containing protein/prepilin-type processing-associated H-X9-DG protein|nr:type II secretion system protein [Tepidisphaeraceae bacterium]
MLNSKPQPQAFSLVEMLVVIGIIVLLAAILLPVISSARRASTNTKCLNNLREIDSAITQYMRDNDESLPAAVSSNTWDDPISPNGAILRDPKASPPFAPAVAYCLDPYLKYDLRVWQCPGTRVVRSEPDRIFRTHQVLRTDNTHTSDNSPMWSTSGQWRPGYMYMSALGWGWYETHEPQTWNTYGMSEWTVRNIAGLKLADIRTMTLQPSSAVCLFYDYNSAYHSKSADDVYELQQISSNFTSVTASNIKRGVFQSNFAFLDGHVESKRYTWQGGLLNAVHKPIPQGDLRKIFPDSYTRVFPD